MRRPVSTAKIIVLLGILVGSVFLVQRSILLHNLLARSQDADMRLVEDRLIALVNGSRAYDYNLELENISYAYPDFRSSGSSGAVEAANWIKEKFESFGLQSWLEPFQFTNWTLLNNVSLAIDLDGNPSTTGDQTTIASFQCDHLSWPTSGSGIFASLVVLPLPEISDRSQIGVVPIDMALWNSIDTTGKIVLVGREVRSHPNWADPYANKLSMQPPSAVVYTWWYNWDSFIPPFFSSGGGVPLNRGYYWNSEIPVGFLDYGTGVWINASKNTFPSLAANITIPAAINGFGTHYNVVGKINGLKDPEKLAIISAHYDTVMCSGFCDNGAGTAGIVELAKVFSEAAQSGAYRPDYTLLFVGFAGEEYYLVGSANYVRQHIGDMANITAVINLDCIGSDDLYVSETPGSSLASTIVQAAQDLGVDITTEPPGGSDHETFLYPSYLNDMVQLVWGVDLGISDATPVVSSAMLDSYPLLYSDLWNRGVPGWIHTSYDNSTSTSALNWVEKDDLGNHLKVAALSIMRFVPGTHIPLEPDIAITEVIPYKSVVGYGQILRMNVTVANQWTQMESFNVTVYVNGTLVERREMMLAGQTSEILSFVSDTIGFAHGNYAINAYAEPVSGELDTADNNLTYRWVAVTILGDVTGDVWVDMQDISIIIDNFMATPPSWNPNCDVNDDSTIDMADISIAIEHFMQK